MFRILIQLTPATATKPATYQWLMSDSSTVWETDDKDAALDRYETELSNFKRSILTLVRVVAVELNPTADIGPCPYPDGDDQEY